ncbi:MAG: hypothetical protein ACLPKB_20555 [Xanthobacteraceae bacterium]
MAAGLFTILSVAYLLNGPSAPVSGSATAPPALPSDPASDLRLADYEAAYDEAMKIAGVGERCEKMVAALGRLTDEDRARGRNVRASSKGRISALTAGDRCRSDVAVSDKHFASFETAIAAAETSPSPATIKAAAEATALLDGFDRSRSRYVGEAGLLVKGKEFAGVVASSDAHIAALVAVTEALAGDQSGAVYLRLADAMKQLTDFDRGRLTPGQRASLDASNRALATLNASRTRLAKLAPLLAAMQAGQTQEMAQRLVAATAAVTSFDEAVATPEQKDALAKARTAVKTLSWALLHDRVNILAQGETPEGDEAVAAVYQLVKDAPAAELTGPRRALLAKGAAAALAVATSNDRLDALIAAADKWRQRNGTIDRGALAPRQAITPFDQKRFQDRHKAAWDTLSRAEAIIRGPELGLTAQTKGQIAIFVFSSRQGELDRAVAEALRASLRSDGFQIVTSRNDAALLSDVYIERVDDPVMDTSGVSLSWKVTAQLTVNAVWCADDSSLFADSVQQSVSAQDRDGAKTAALRASVSAIAKMFEGRTRK